MAHILVWLLEVSAAVPQLTLTRLSPTRRSTSCTRSPTVHFRVLFCNVILHFLCPCGAESNVC